MSRGTDCAVATPITVSGLFRWMNFRERQIATKNAIVVVKKFPLVMFPKLGTEKDSPEGTSMAPGEGPNGVII